MNVKKYLLLLPFLFLLSCSQFSNSITSRSWHNLNSKYNALWIAKFNYQIIEDSLFNNREEDYTKVLPIFVHVDTVASKSMMPYLQEVIKKSSIVAERHSNSKYLDEAYNLLGQARLLKSDYHNAAEVFKYVNTNGTSETQKQLALIYLMRTFIEQGELNDANEVSNILKTIPLTKENKTTYFITKAYFHQKNGEDLIAAAILDEVVGQMKKGEKRGRLYFIAGQIYERNGRFDLANQCYAKVLKNNPNYDLEFNAKVNQLASNQSVDSFKALLNDRKNENLKDQIYYKMGDLEVANKNYPLAIEYFNKSIQVGSKENKAKAYYAIGKLYYNQLSDLEKAAKYYDSTLVNLPPTDPLYADLMKMNASLNDFVRYSNALKLEDSLQNLASLNPLALNQKIDEMIAAKNAKQIESKTTESTTIYKSIFKKKWELYDPIVMGVERAEFFRKYGSITLADDWNRRENQTATFSMKIERLTNDEIEAEAKAKLANDAKIEADNAANLANEREAILAKLPLTEPQMVASKRKQEEAIFNLGKIYQLQFKQIENAKKMFLKLVNEFPTSGYVPEALYFLALSETNQQTNPYKTELIKNYPGTSFARQLLKGKVEITSSLENEANEVYKFVFDTYSKKEYDLAVNQANEAMQKYLGTAIEEKFALIKIMALAKGTNQIAYRIAVEDYISSYPSSKSIALIKSFRDVLVNNK